MPNNVAEELSSKLPSQIGSVAPTQLGLKYGNCISHYGAVGTVQGELLKVRCGGVVGAHASGVICCADLCLHSRKERHDEGTAGKERSKGGMINKHGWIDFPWTYIRGAARDTGKISVSAQTYSYQPFCCISP